LSPSSQTILINFS